MGIGEPIVGCGGQCVGACGHCVTCGGQCVGNCGQAVGCDGQCVAIGRTVGCGQAMSGRQPVITGRQCVGVSVGRMQPANVCGCGAAAANDSTPPPPPPCGQVSVAPPTSGHVHVGCTQTVAGGQLVN